MIIEKNKKPREWKLVLNIYEYNIIINNIKKN